MNIENRVTICVMTIFILISSCASGQSNSEKELMVDGRTYVKTIGKGNPVLIINGGPGLDSEGFKSLADGLSDEYQMILFDQRGTGKSPLAQLDSTTLKLDSMVMDMEHIRTALGLDDWVLLGHSFGGMLASYYTAKFPERVRGIILSSSGGIDLQLLTDGFDITAGLSQQNRDSLAYYGELAREEGTSTKVWNAYCKFLAPAYLYDQKYVSLVADRLSRVNREINGQIWSDMRNMNFDCSESLSTFKEPVLIIQGEHDVLSKDLAFYADSVFAKSKLVFVDQAAHYGWLENPETYYGEVRDYLSAIYRKGE